MIAGTEFVKLGCLPDCDGEDVVQVSARINVGHPASSVRLINGLQDRKDRLVIWRKEFGVA